MGKMEGMRQTTLYVDPTLYEQARIVASKTKRPIYGFVGDALKAEIEKHTTPEERAALEMFTKTIPDKPAVGLREKKFVPKKTKEKDHATSSGNGNGSGNGHGNGSNGARAKLGVAVAKPPRVRSGAAEGA